MKSQNIYHAVATGIAITVLLSSCSTNLSGYAGNPPAVVSDACCAKLEIRTVRKEVSVTVALAGAAAWAVQNPETVRKVAGGIYNVIAGGKKVEPLPQRSADSQGVYGYDAKY